jgi:hypothetical protein
MRYELRGRRLSSALSLLPPDFWLLAPGSCPLTSAS